MKTAISLPDEDFNRATSHAIEIGISRSELFVKALRQYFNARDEAETLKQINQVCAQTNTVNEFDSVAKSTLLNSEW